MFDFKKPTAQMLGRWQPWHDGHTELFKKTLEDVGQVCIMVRDVPVDSEANSRVPGQDDNPFNFAQVLTQITSALREHGYKEGREYVIIHVPNIVDISYGRGVGYTFTEHDLGKEVHNISATKIRKEMREQGKLN